MNRRLLALVAATGVTSAFSLVCLAGCDTSPAANVSAQRLAATASAQKASKLDPKLKKADYEAGLANGIAIAAGKTPQVKQGKVDQLSFDYGYVVGLLTGSINAFNRIDGSFDVYEWKSFCYMNVNAMKEARDAIRNNPDLAAKVAVTLGILEGGIESFGSINGSFDVSQWKAFAYSNKKMLESALSTLKNTSL